MTFFQVDSMHAFQEENRSEEILDKFLSPGYLRRFMAALLVLWTASILTLFFWSVWQQNQQVRSVALAEARAYLNRDEDFRLWVASHGGMYVPIDKRTPPNPLLTHVPERDLITPDGTHLTLMNSAYVLRQVSQDYADLQIAASHLTSLNPYRKENAPDDWEKAALIAFEKGETEAFEFTDINSITSLRLMRPILMKESCLKCHAQQGYQVGDIRGGVAVVLETGGLLAATHRYIFGLGIGFGALWLFGSVGILSVSLRIFKVAKERERSDAQLRYQAQSLANVKDAIIATDEHLMITSWNPAAEAIYGWTAGEVTGCSLPEVLPIKFSSTAWEEVIRTIVDGLDFHKELEQQRKDGTWIPVETVVRPIRDKNGRITGYVGVNRDISERKRAEDELRTQKEILQKIFDHIPVMIDFITEDGRIHLVNREWERTLGWSLEEIQRENIDVLAELYPDLQDRQEVLNFLAAVDTKWGDFKIRVRDGRVIDTSWYDIRLSDGTSIGIGLDITQRKAAERDLARRMAELEALYTVARVGTESDTLDELVAKVVRILEERLYAGAIGIGFLDKEDGLLTFHPAARNCVENMDRSIPISLGISGWVAQNRTPRRAGDVHGEPDYFESRPDTRAELCVPITIGEDLIGVINIESPCLDAFSEADERLLMAVAGEMSTAVEKIRLLEAERHQRAELEVLAEISAVVRVAENREAMLPILMERITKIFSAQGAAIAFRDPRDEALLYEQGWGDWAGIRGIRVPFRKGITGYVAATKEIFVSDDARNNPQLFRKDYLGAVSALLCLPLSLEEEIVAVLSIGRSVPFQPSDVRLARAMGNIIASGIHRVQLYSQTQQQLERLTALREIDQAILYSHELNPCLEMLLEKITSLLRVDAAGILLYDTRTHLLRLSAAKGFLNTLPKELPLHVIESIAGNVIWKREMELVPDIHLIMEKKYDVDLEILGPFTGYLAVPLVAKGEIKGVLSLFNRTLLEPTHDWVDFLQTLAGQAAIAIDNAQLFEEQQQTNQQLLEAYDNTIDGWSRALDLRDKETEGHSRRVTEYTLRLAERLGIPQEKLSHIRRGAQLHDIGKMGIPDKILLKQDSLTDAEWEIMRKHPTYALNLLYPVEFLRPALEIPTSHHEKWDGSGYPQGLIGEEIPLSARIFAVVDVWDALISDRPYRPAWSKEKAIEYMQEQAGKHFDPDILHEFLEMVRFDLISGTVN